MNVRNRRPLISHRSAVGTYFGLVGVAVGVWVARIPEIQTKLHLDDGQLGLVLLMSAAGALAGMPLTSRLSRRFDPRGMAWGTAALVCGLLPSIALAPGSSALMAVFTAYGATTGILGVVINAMAVEVEAAEGRSILSSFHGLFSLGGLIGSSIAATCMAWSVGPVPSLLGAAGGIAVLFLVTGPGLPVASIGQTRGSQDAARSAQASGSRPWGRLILLGGLAFLGLMGEGSMGDWSAVYLKRSLGASAALAGLGYAAFSLGMTAGRFSGDWLSTRLGDVTLLRGGAGLAAVGLFGAVLIGHPWAAVVGFVLVGVGLANAVPILYRAAARTPAVEAVVGIATTSTVGYFGFLAGPPLIGLIANQTTLDVALGCVAIAIGVVAVGGGQVRSGQGHAVAAANSEPLARA